MCIKYTFLEEEFELDREFYFERFRRLEPKESF